MAAAETETRPVASHTYPAGCHCGYIQFDVTLSPPLEERKVLDCGCSMCQRAGYLLVYPKKEDVKWHGESRARCAVYRFNTRQKDQLFCPRCGASLGIDFRESKPPRGYGISLRTFNGIDVRQLKNIVQGNGKNNVDPPEDLSGRTYTEDTKQTEEKEIAAG